MKWKQLIAYGFDCAVCSGKKIERMRGGNMRKTWQQKLEDKESFPKVLRLEKGFPCYNGVHKMGANVRDKVVLVNPSEVIEFMKLVPTGKLTTSIEICRKIATTHGVPACCTLTTGIFIMTAANAVEEAKREGKKRYQRND